MLKFIKHNLDTIAGIDIFPVISFIIFFIFFIGLFVWVFKINKTELEIISNLPLEGTEGLNSGLNNKTQNS
jgi:hypothetical protein